jgi:hypothetical protein
MVSKPDFERAASGAVICLAKEIHYKTHRKETSVTLSPPPTKKIKRRKQHLYGGMTKKDEVKGALLDMEMCNDSKSILSASLSQPYVHNIHIFFCISQVVYFLTKNFSSQDQK